MRPLILLLTLFSAAFINGCCFFIPCHPATRAVGFATNTEGMPIQNASVSLYGSKLTTGPNGCFNFNLADALPFTFTATASGHKPIEVPSKPGFFIIKVKLAPIDSNSVSEVVWEKISSEEFRDSKTKSCP